MSNCRSDTTYDIYLFPANLNWVNFSIFIVRTAGSNPKERSEFHRMANQRGRKKTDMILAKSTSRFGAIRWLCFVC